VDLSPLSPEAFHRGQRPVPEYEVSIRQVQGMRAVGMNPIDENDVAPEDKDDLDDIPNIKDIHADTDIDEGDEEKDDGTGLPPAMPPPV
jgi:hypothetical protein